MARAAGESSAVDFAVRMKRIPREAMLDSLLARGLAGRGHIDRLVELLVAFYRGAPPAPAGGALGSPAALRRTITENFELTRPFVGEVLPPGRFHATRSAQLTFLSLQEELFEERLRRGFVRDGHGDLRAEHVAYLPGCAIMDCIEFNERLRVIDIAADLAFLKMDLEFLQAPELGSYLIDRYAQLSGDQDLRRVLEFYVSYRAYVRGKVDSIKLHQPEVDSGEVFPSALVQAL